MKPLQTRIALVTGASSGIGRAAAVRLANLGASVALVARTVSALEEVAAEIARAGGRALVVPADVTDSEQCRRAVKRTVEHHGRLDILLCSAGVSMRARFEDSDLAAMEAVMRANFYGTLYPTHHALPHIKSARGSLIA